VLIRAETKQDIEVIHDVTVSAFDTDAEARLVTYLRDDGDLTISLVAEVEGRIVGHIALSPMTAPVKTLGLGPVSVRPKHQNGGIGSALIRKSIDLAKQDGYQAIFLLGHAHYYPRFGFSPALAEGFISPYASPNFMALELEPGCLSEKGHRVDYAPGFSKI